MSTAPAADRLPRLPTGGHCQGAYEPPRYCSACGRRLRVVIIPTGWTARCRDHGPVATGAGSDLRDR